MVSFLPDAVRRRPADDLAALAELVGDARVVGIGENNHGVREFGELRADVVRFLTRELGFGVVALESGLVEGARVDAWVQGAPGDLPLDGFTFRAGEAAEMQALVRDLREYRADGGRVRFSGIDVPGSGGSPHPALELVREHLRVWAPDAVVLVDEAEDATALYSALNNGAAPQRYAELDAAARDRATSTLARLLLRVEALGPGPEHRLARHHAAGALRLDEQLREFAVLFSPDPPAHVVSSRDVYMAESVRLRHELHGADTRIVVLAHNGHLQRVPFAFLPGVSAPSAGARLAQSYGDDYVVVGLTALAGTTPGLALDDVAPCGMTMHSETLGEPVPGSVEQAVAAAGHEPVLLDLRTARGAAGPTAIRHATTHIAVDVVAGYDAIYCLPEQHCTDVVTAS